MRFKDFRLLRKGWNDKLLYEQKLLRHSTFIISGSWQKITDLRKAWPEPGQVVKMVEYRGMHMSERMAKKLKRHEKHG